MKATFKIEMRKDYATKDGKRPICLRYTANRRTTLISLNILIKPRHWNKVSCTVRDTEPRSYYYNKAISEFYQKADTIIMENFFKPLSISQFIEKIRDKSFGNTDFYVFIENEIELLKKVRASGTIENYNKLINTLKAWKPTLSFDEITLDFIQQFHNHELEVGNLPSTIYKKHANFKFLIGIAVDKEKIAKTPYEKFEIKKNIKAQNNDVLTEDELKRLQDAYNKKKYSKGKQEVLREFLFACYTSLAYAEYSIVTFADIKLIKIDTGEYYPLLSNERTKTDITYKIPIVSPKVVALIGEGEPSQNIFSPISNQPTNRYLKSIMKDLHIEKEMTFHRARHTFRTIAARKGINDGIAERIMGHAEGNEIKDIYIHLHDEDIIKEMISKWIV
ncbi:site-specific integrase [Bacteroides sp. Phil13]|uniref:site-specific integrase n=1 Tax=Bacteroides sp. Phil13 TaxID=1929999 RepID=UPI000ADC8FB6|nr:site-specific integrase [Bacteroides sp. Phil13]